MFFLFCENTYTSVLDPIGFQTTVFKDFDCFLKNYLLLTKPAFIWS